MSGFPVVDVVKAISAIGPVELGAMLTDLTKPWIRSSTVIFLPFLGMKP